MSSNGGEVDDDASAAFVSSVGGDVNTEDVRTGGHCLDEFALGGLRNSDPGRGSRTSNIDHVLHILDIDPSAAEEITDGGKNAGAVEVTDRQRGSTGAAGEVDAVGRVAGLKVESNHPDRLGSDRGL